MKKCLFCLIFYALIQLIGCTSISEVPFESGSPPQITVEDKAAESSISSDLLYLLLGAEIAGQKGVYEVSLENYIKATKWTNDPKIAERATQIALFNNNEEKASEAVTLWLQMDEESVDARKIAAMLEIKQGKYEKAISHLRFLKSKEGKGFRKIIMDMARHIDKEDSKEGAFDFMDRLDKAFPDDPDVHYAYALLAMTKTDWGQAHNEILKAIQLRPQWKQARIVEVRILAQKGNSEKALSLLKDMIAEDPESDELHMIYAQYLVDLKDYDLAEIELQEIVTKKPKHYDAIYSLALVKMQNKQPDEARNLFYKLIDVPKWQNQAFYYLGRIDAKKNQIKNAISWLEKINSGPLVLDAQMTIVSLLAADKRLGEAQTNLRALHRHFPAQAHRFYLLEAELLNENHDYEGAFRVLSQALESLPDHTQLLYTRALVAERLDRLDILERDLLRILEKTPDDPNALNALGYTLADRTDRYEEARAYLDRAIQLKPDDPVIMDSYGWLQYRLGDFQIALDYLQRAYKLHEDPEIAAHLGEILWVKGQKDEAKAVWKKALSEDPNSTYLLKIKESFPKAFNE